MNKDKIYLMVIVLFFFYIGYEENLAQMTQKVAEERLRQRAEIDKAYEDRDYQKIDSLLIAFIDYVLPEDSLLREAEKFVLKEFSKAGLLIRVSEMRWSYPNFVGGVDVNLEFQNLSKKTIKYVYFTVQAYNAVDDPAECEIRNSSRRRLEKVGPIKPLEFTSGEWENVWYNSTIAEVKLEEVGIEYMDGSETILKSRDLRISYENWGRCLFDGRFITSGWQGDVGDCLFHKRVKSKPRP